MVEREWFLIKQLLSRRKKMGRGLITQSLTSVTGSFLFVYQKSLGLGPVFLFNFMSSNSHFCLFLGCFITKPSGPGLPFFLTPLSWVCYWSNRSLFQCRQNERDLWAQFGLWFWHPTRNSFSRELKWILNYIEISTSVVK